MSIHIETVSVRCDGKDCPVKWTKEGNLTVNARKWYSYEWCGTLEENIGTLFKTYHQKLDEDIYADALGDETPKELVGWTFETDGISCDYVLCPECSAKKEEEE